MDNNSRYDLNNAEMISMLEELSLWSAPFGLKLLDNIRYKKEIKALDIGFGTGFPLIELAMRLGNTSEIYGLDPWKAAIERCKFKIKYHNLSNIKIFEGCAEAMPFENDYFDLITSNNGLNNVQDLSKSLSECYRVAKMGAQFVFTYNSADSFIEFYDIFRDVINKNGLQEFNKDISSHIHAKRKPLNEFENELKKAGFEIESVKEDKFFYRFADGTSFFNHFFIKLAFLESWEKIVPENKQVDIFKEIEFRINDLALVSDGFCTQVPFYTINCFKS